MIKTSFPLERELGISWYCSDMPGIGGHIRDEPDDFIVEELSDIQPQSGSYLLCRLTKRNWDQQRAIREIANRLAISHQRIGFAGTKDKRAVTTQFITIHTMTPEQVTNIHISDMQIHPVGYVQEQLSLGDLSGNRFDVTITGSDMPDSTFSLDSILPQLSTGIPNYFGYQRFGVRRPITHLVGLHLLKGEYEEAARTFIGQESADEDEEIIQGRRYFMETGDPKGTLHLLPPRLYLDRSLLHYLTEHPGDYAGAFHSFPRTLRSMFVSAAQSLFFNKTLSMRIEEERGLQEPGVGDWLIFSDGKEDQITDATLRLAAMQLKRERCSLAIHIQGSQDLQREGPDDKNMQYLMEEAGITTRMFGTVSEYLGTRFDGALRKITLQTDIKQIPADRIRLQFSLHPGQYATTVLREIMKSPPEMMI